ncbi:unnamed protein product [Boreogadus saida]
MGFNKGIKSKNLLAEEPINDFLTAQLVCEDRPSGQRYNVLTDVFTLRRDPSDPASTQFHGLFTSQWERAELAAVCVFSPSDINQVMDGPFKELKKTCENWINPEPVPGPRPGQAFRSLKDPPPTRDRTTVEVRPPSYLGTLRSSLDRLEETLNLEMKKLPDVVELKRVQQYEVDVTLDPDTAHLQLILSEDWKEVHDGGVAKKLTDNPKRFTNGRFVVTRQSFSSGRFYFEVQVKDKNEWRLGMARESIDRKLQIIVTPERGYWTLRYDKDGLYFRGNPAVRLPLRAELQKVGVFVDYDEGLVSFYDVEARVRLYSDTRCTFN